VRRLPVFCPSPARPQPARGELVDALAHRLVTILPAMPLAEAIETTRIHRVAGLTGAYTALVITHPFRAPHHTISDVGLIGGGHVLMPGDVLLAHQACPSWRRAQGGTYPLHSARNETGASDKHSTARAS
jgi:Magnesium chelatase, subunit ChlI